MLWYLDYEITKWFLIFCLTSALLSTILISILPIHRIIKVILIVFVLVQTYLSFFVTENMLGKPKPNEYNIDGSVEGFTVYLVNKQKRIAILIKLKDEKRPVTISIPWSEETQKNLQQAMESKGNGLPIGVREKEEEQENNSSSQSLEFYNIYETMMPQKE